MAKFSFKKLFAGSVLSAALALAPASLVGAAAALVDPVTVQWDAGDLTIVNNPDGADTVTLINMKPNEVLKVYDTAGTKLLGQATVKKGATTATVSLSGKNALLKTADSSIMVTVVLETPQKSVATKKPIQTTALNAVADISYANTLKTDSVTVANLTYEGTVVSLYESVDPTVKAKAKGTFSKKKDAANKSVIINFPLNKDGGNIWVTVKEPKKTESSRVQVAYLAEPTTVAPNVTDLAYTNVINTGTTKDTITVKAGLKVDDVVKVYKVVSSKDVLIATSLKATGTTITFNAPLDSAGGTVKVTITSKDQHESAKVDLVYGAQPASDLGASNFTFVAGSGAGKVKATKLPLGTLKYVVGAAGTQTKPNFGADTTAYTGSLIKGTDVTANTGDHIFIISIDSKTSKISGWVDIVAP